MTITVRLFFVAALLMVKSAIASVTWTTDWPVIVITQGFGQDSFSQGASAGLESSAGANGNGGDQDYQIYPEQLGISGSAFQLVNVADPSDTITINNLNYNDNQGFNNESLVNLTDSGTFRGRAAGTSPQLTVQFTVGGCFFIWCGTESWGNSYAAIIDLCAFKDGDSCGGGGGGNVQYDHSRVVILFRGFTAGGGLVVIDGLDNMTLTDQGANWSASDDFCVGATAGTSIQLKAESLRGAADFELARQGGGGPNLPYSVTVNGQVMAEDQFESFTPQSLAECFNSQNDFDVDVAIPSATIASSLPGDYDDTLTITVEPL